MVDCFISVVRTIFAGLEMIPGLSTDLITICRAEFAEVGCTDGFKCVHFVSDGVFCVHAFIVACCYEVESRARTDTGGSCWDHFVDCRML